ncbi:nucleosome assembly protein 1-like 5 [Octodon degus]|uniref:Nucleosome assembly protein 1-like 5 n=1 Tax=Octodon degus TaxID=10160 RepID=A0A6P3V8E8_OCTDE|nr:nucleosome assembly protein 1-like 5 [Octodon degus]
MADAESRGPAEPRRAAAEEEASAAAEPQPPAEGAPKPKNDFLESLPNSVRCRVLALKKLQKRCDKIEAKFDKEFQALEKKYNDIYKPLLAKIQELTGEMEGCAWTLEGEDEDVDEDDEVQDQEEDEDEGQEADARACGTLVPADPKK